METQPSPTEIVGFHVTPGQIIAAGCCLAIVVLVGFYLSSKRRSGK